MRLLHLWVLFFLALLFIFPLKTESFVTTPGRNSINLIYLPLLPYCNDYSKPCGQQLDWVLTNFKQICKNVEIVDNTRLHDYCKKWYTPEELENRVICLTKGICNVVEVPKMQKDTNPQSNESQDDEFNNLDSDGGREFNNNRNLPPLQRKKPKDNKRR